MSVLEMSRRGETSSSIPAYAASRQSISNADNRKDSVDMVTESLTLRFLALMLQNDDTFLKDFCAKDGIRHLRSFLLNHSVDLTVVTYLIGILFRIPIDRLIPFDSLKILEEEVGVGRRCDGLGGKEAHDTGDFKTSSELYLL